MNDKVSSDELRHVTEICERAAQGDLEARIIGIDPATEFGRLCGAINHMLDIGDSFVREASAAMDSCSHDRFHRPILLPGLTGAYRKSAATINRAGVKMQRSSERLDYRMGESLMLIIIDLLGLILKYLETVVTICLTLPGIDDQLRLVEML